MLRIDYWQSKGRGRPDIRSSSEIPVTEKLAQCRVAVERVRSGQNRDQFWRQSQQALLLDLIQGVRGRWCLSVWPEQPEGWSCHHLRLVE